MVRELKLVLRKNLYTEKERERYSAQRERVTERESETVRPIGSLKKWTFDGYENDGRFGCVLTR